MIISNKARRIIILSKKVRANRDSPRQLYQSFFIFFLFLSHQTIHAQQNEIIPKHILSDYSTDKKELLNYNSVPEKYQSTFAEDNAFNKFNLVFYHNIYYNQPILEGYIRSILTRLDPQNSSINQLDIYITKETQFNAFTIVDGSVFVNISVLADMSSEAELAYLIGHEYGHYKLKHVLQGYVKQREIGKSPSNKKVEENWELHQKLELQADSLGYKMAYDAGYDYRAMDLLLQRLLFYQKKGSLLQYKDYNSERVMPTSHPVGEERLLNIKKLNNVSNNGLFNPSGEERFQNIKQLAEFEYLKVLDESSDILEAISFPLKKFLLTNDKKYLPVLVRATRKAMLLIPNINEKGFLTAHFFDSDQKFGKDSNIFTNLFYEYPDSNDVEKMYQNEFVDFNKINKYDFETAFEYFADLATEDGFQEPYLDLALHYGVDKSKGKKAINAYLLKENNLYYDYARNLKEKKIVSSLQNGEDILLIGGIEHYTFKKKWVYHDHETYLNARHNILANLREKYTKHELEYKLYDYLDFVQKNEIGSHLATIERLIYSGYATKILEYDPRLYYILKQANIRSLEYLKINHYNIRKRAFLIPLRIVALPYRLLMHTPLFAQHISTAHYYRLGLSETNVVGVNNGFYKGSFMTTRRGQRILYKLHKNTRKITTE